MGDPFNNYTLVIHVTCYDSSDATGVFNITLQVKPLNSLPALISEAAQLATSAISTTADFLVQALITYTDALNSYDVIPPYAGNFTLINGTLAQENAILAAMATDYQRYMTEVDALTGIRGDIVTWLSTVGIPTSSVNSLTGFCSVFAGVLSNETQANNSDMLDAATTLVLQAIDLLTNYSADSTIDPSAMDAAAGACSNAVGMLIQAVTYSVGDAPAAPSAGDWTTTTPGSTSGRKKRGASKSGLGGLSAVARLTKLTAITKTVNTCMAKVQTTMLKSKGVNEAPSVVGGTSARQAISVKTVSAMNNVTVPAGGSSDCGSFGLGDANSMFESTIGPRLQAQTGTPNITQFLQATPVHVRQSSCLTNLVLVIN
jgi:hypothetical protein